MVREIIKFVSVAVVTVVGFAGCADAWQHDPSLEGPWCAPNLKAQIFSRNNGDLWNPVIERAWENAHGKKSLILDAFDSSDDFLEASGVLSQWRPLQQFVNDTQMHLAPYTRSNLK